MTTQVHTTHGATFEEAVDQLFASCSGDADLGRFVGVVSAYKLAVDHNGLLSQRAAAPSVCVHLLQELFGQDKQQTSEPMYTCALDGASFVRVSHALIDVADIEDAAFASTTATSRSTLTATVPSVHVFVDEVMHYVALYSTLDKEPYFLGSFHKYKDDSLSVHFVVAVVADDKRNDDPVDEVLDVCIQAAVETFVVGKRVDVLWMRGYAERQGYSCTDILRQPRCH